MILIVSNTITLIGLKRMREKIEHGIHTVLNRKRIEMERRIVKSKKLLEIILNYNFFSFNKQVLLSQHVVLFSLGHLMLLHCLFQHFVEKIMLYHH